MIKIIFKKNHLEISGHAYSGEQDIVCAAVSSVACSAYIKWEKNKHFSLSEDDKVPSVSFLINEKNTNNLQEHIEFDFFIFMLKQIHCNYPDNVEWIDSLN